MPVRSARPAHRRHRLLQMARVPVLAASLALAACTGQGTTPQPTASTDTPQRAAAQLATGLTRLDVSGVDFAGISGSEANQRLQPLVAGMGSTRPTVTVGPIDRQGDRASAMLHLDWGSPGFRPRWSYDTTAQLMQESGQWKASWQPTLVHPGLDGSNRLSQQRVPAQRGRVLGMDGEAIVKLRPVVRIGIDKSQVSAGSVTAAATRLAELVGIDPKSYAHLVGSAGAQAFVEAIVLRAGSGERTLNAKVLAITGARSIRGQRMLAPSRTFARTLLGTVGDASGEVVASSDGAVVAGDQVGRSGLQRRYDEQLRGTSGVTVQLVPARRPDSASPSPSPRPDAQTQPVTVFQSRPVAGKDLTISLDISLQTLAERTLADTAPASAIVAIRPSTGAIVAAANGPGTNQPIASVGRYPPGSTFKVATSLALLRSRLKLTSPVTCPSTVTVDGKNFTNYSDYPKGRLGTINLKTALAQSCNTAFIGQRARLSGTDLADAAASLGLGVDYDVGFPSFFGSVPVDTTATGRAASMIGQGKVLASPMAMAGVAASVSVGRTVLPTLVAGHSASPRAIGLTSAEAAELRQMMAGVVAEGSGRFLQRQDGPPVIAKTGTAEFGSKPVKTHAWMIGAQGDLAVAVFVDVGKSGSRTAGPLLARFLSGAG